MGSLSMLNKGPKKGELLGVAGDHSLGVPLDREKEAAWALNPLDDPVGGDGADLEVGRQVADDLVVGAGHRQLPDADDFGEVGTRSDGNRMSWLRPPLPGAVVGWVSPLTIGKILVEAAAQSNVEDLEAPADP